FNKKVRPLLNQHCVECHGPKKQKGELRLDAKAFAFKGGHDGVAIKPGDSAGSPLFQRLTNPDDDQRMPPKGERLSTVQIQTIKAWIDAGAVWPESAEDRLATTDKRLDHWAWKAVQAAPPNASIDSLIGKELAAHSLQPSPEADRRTLIRRLSFDLLGLPPSPEETTAFITDASKDAYEHLVDRMLASPHYGERWARHWLDIAHYADTHGFERDKLRENAWRYRDYVVNALNDDKPYDQFLREQIAGDVIKPDDESATIATGFLAAGPWDFVGQAETKSPTLQRAARADDLDDMITQVMTSTCAISINCARCHDHKLDPISQQEYYSLWAVFAGTRRADREIESEAVRQAKAERAQINQQVGNLTHRLFELGGGGLDLADVVGGGDGSGNGTKGMGIDPRTGLAKKDGASFLTDVKPNEFVQSKLRYIDGVVIPGGGEPVVISSTGIKTPKISKTSASAWDAIRNGPVRSQDSTEIGAVNYNTPGHSLLGLHANAAITFDLRGIRKTWGDKPALFHAVAGYGGKAKSHADVQVFLDGKTVFNHAKLGAGDSATIDFDVPVTADFLTLMATDGGDGIGHDQVFFGDPRLQILAPGDAGAELAALTQERSALQAKLKALPVPPKVYAVVPDGVQAVSVLRRGDPEQPADKVQPGTISCLAGMKAALGDDHTPEGERRKHLAEWITNPVNPLTRRVIVNRLWHHHFGAGIVDTPSDFGLGGNKPSHPELLDWLAEELLHSGWSLKHMHKLMVMSATYRQSSKAHQAALAVDASNRLLWRMNPRRLEAESMRDAVLTVAGSLNPAMGGPGYRDFNYTEAYAPIYDYITADSAELWRRSIYRFVVRTTVQPLMTTLDCPNPANLTPSRIVTTTALQSLALMNNDFMLRQADHFAERLQRDAGADSTAQIRRAFNLAFAREPNAEELSAAVAFVKTDGLFALCRMLLNANEFAYVD
ncbi:MAG: Planctomycete cytochrome, partial [Verrucomicrobiaceae bacterium]|nr:Planctomycete cytochrome [Verrucomicrobiaceae bacterium]